MRRKNNIDTLIFSYLSGYNYYNTDAENADKIKANHCKSDTEVDICFDFLPSLEPAFWRSYVMYPPYTNNIKWPIDVVKFEFESKIKYGLVYRKRAYPKLNSLKELIYDDRLLDWRQENIKKLIANIVVELLTLKKSGYIYHSYDINHIFYDPENMNVYFDFSTSITKFNEDVYYEEKLIKNDVSIDFMPPWMNNKNRISGYANAVSAYYSLSALLFRLMIGRLPYQGKLLDGSGDLMNYIRDTDENLHKSMMDFYFANPIFIFDEDDDSNSIGIFMSEENFIERWKALDKTVKAKFLNVFSKDSLNGDKQSYCTIEEWYETLISLEEWRKYFDMEKSKI